jgi:hypothetical protein
VGPRMDARVGATSQPQGIVLTIKASFDGTDVNSDVHSEKIREEKGKSYTNILQVWNLCERPRFVSLVLLPSGTTAPLHTAFLVTDHRHGVDP